MATKRDGFYKRAGSRYWWVRTDPLEGVPRSTGCTDLEAAKRWRAARERMAADPAHAAAQTAQLGTWVARTLAMIARDRSEATLEIYTTKLGHFRRIWGDDSTLASITPVTVDSYVQQRRGEGASDETISREVRHLGFLLRLAKRSGAYAGDVTTLKPLDLRSSYTPRKRALTRAEVVAVVGQLRPPVAALVAFCVALGCRRGEALRLTQEDIDLERWQATIPGTKTAESARTVPILTPFRALVQSAREHLPFDLDATNVNRELEQACIRAGIEHASFNDLRRTHATLLIEHGVDRDVVRRLLGHTTAVLVDRVYGRPSPEALAGLAEARLLSAAPVQVRDSAVEVLTESGRPQRGSNPRYRRERPFGWYGSKAEVAKTPSETPVSTAGRRWRRVATDASTLQWFGRRTAAERVAEEVLRG